MQGLDTWWVDSPGLRFAGPPSLPRAVKRVENGNGGSGLAQMQGLDASGLTQATNFVGASRKDGEKKNFFST
jgi:hypothetical protein